MSVCVRESVCVYVCLKEGEGGGGGGEGEKELWGGEGREERVGEVK